MFVCLRYDKLHIKLCHGDDDDDDDDDDYDYDMISSVSPVTRKTLYEIWAKSNNPRQSYCDLNIRLYDLEHVSRVLLCCGIIFTKLKLSQPIRSRNVTIVLILCSTMTLTFDPLTLNICGTSDVTWSKSVRNLSEIEQFPAELLMI